MSLRVSQSAIIAEVVLSDGGFFGLLLHTPVVGALTFGQAFLFCLSWIVCHQITPYFENEFGSSSTTNKQRAPD